MQQREQKADDLAQGFSFLFVFFLKRKTSVGKASQSKTSGILLLPQQHCSQNRTMRLIISLETPGEAGTFLTVASIFRIPEAASEIAYSQEKWFQETKTQHNLEKFLLSLLPSLNFDFWYFNDDIEKSLLGTIMCFLGLLDK